MKKRIIALLLVLIMSVCILSVAAFADSGASTMSARSGSYYDGGYLFISAKPRVKFLIIQFAAGIRILPYTITYIQFSIF